MFLVSYSRTEYDIVLEDHIEIFFKDCDNENNCGKHEVRAPKVIKRKLPRKAHKKVIDDDDLKVKKKNGKRLMKEQLLIMSLQNYQKVSSLFVSNFEKYPVKCVLTI